MLVIFLLTQVFDGVFTYIGILQFGLHIEANFLVAAMMYNFGIAGGLLWAKITACILGIALHIRGVHGAVAALALFYVAVAIGPWIAILFNNP